VNGALVAARLLLAALGLSFGVVPSGAVATEPGYNMWFAGHVLSVDFQRETFVIARGPTQTSGPAVEVCKLSRKPLRRVRVGMDVEAQADTHRRPWRILHLRVFKINMSHKNPVVDLVFEDRRVKQRYS
jgi:hypothetical protein